jgi:hypothetical protein
MVAFPTSPALKVGDRVRLILMASDPDPVSPGMLGTVDRIDDLGTVHVFWDNGRHLGLVPGIDRYERCEGDDTGR